MVRRCRISRTILRNVVKPGLWKYLFMARRKTSSSGVKKDDKNDADFRWLCEKIERDVLSFHRQASSCAGAFYYAAASRTVRVLLLMPLLMLKEHAEKINDTPRTIINGYVTWIWRIKTASFPQRRSSLIDGRAAILSCFDVLRERQVVVVYDVCTVCTVRKYWRNVGLLPSKAFIKRYLGIGISLPVNVK